MDHLARLIGHLEWADRLVLAALRAADPVLPMWRELYAHVLGAEHVWLARVTGATPRVAVWPQLDLDACGSLAAENAAGLRRLAASLSDGGAARRVRYTNSAGAGFENSVEDILLHLALHGSYHRGQIAAAMRQGGAEPAPTDYIAFIRGAAAATRVAPPMQ